MLALPASWISGFYGSGKSSFAKLLGLALDDATLPGGELLSAALLARDDSPRRHELVEAWKTLRARIDPVAVVFDIGGVARDDEHTQCSAGFTTTTAGQHDDLRMDEVASTGVPLSQVYFRNAERGWRQYDEDVHRSCDAPRDSRGTSRRSHGNGPGTG